MTSMDYSDMFKSKSDFLQESDSEEVPETRNTMPSTFDEHDDIAQWLSNKVSDLGLNIDESNMSNDVVNVLKALFTEVCCLIIMKYDVLIARNRETIGCRSLTICQ
jgi:hypothetical protein